jgi:hypothetical protein
LTRRVWVWMSLDERVLVAGERLELLDQWTVRRQASQVGQITAAGFRQEIGVNGVSLGPRRLAAPVDRLGVDRIHRPARIEEGRDE